MNEFTVGSNSGSTRIQTFWKPHICCSDPCGARFKPLTLESSLQKPRFPTFDFRSGWEAEKTEDKKAYYLNFPEADKLEIGKITMTSASGQSRVDQARQVLLLQYLYFQQSKDSNVFITGEKY
ncbi:unnamed protein product [Porites evermanni]|uniref:Uncharacterized protein n=1 Tax=Porites evermanni TaxID=104178 RepID=A0ABN8RAD1_9CNID|nr:unnamed protein product [Porites evermanni]